MSREHPATAEEWERFRFPARRPRPDRQSADRARALAEDEEGEGDGGEGAGGRDLAPDFPPPPAWEYDARTGFLMNQGLKKKIDLAHLDEAQKIIRMLAVFELRPDLAFASLRRALEAASRDRFGVDVETLLRHHASGQSIPWKAGMHARHGMV